ncbi:MAG TPA: twin-arginine translocase subunit TatC [Solirubrobacteraceae bacterium]|nr:twin-arginine translocase subunit TatC [Solirubrobacteraceae bacterium]
MNLSKAALAGVDHEVRLSLVDHLGELRARLVVSGVALLVAFGLAFWQNHALLNVLNRPLERATAGALKHSRGPLAQSAREQQGLRVALDRQRTAFELLARSASPLDATQRQALSGAAEADAAAAALAPSVAQGRQPVTLGIGEPFAQTVTVAGYFALLLALPVILWQLYAFVIPALSKRERRATLPLLVMAPLLFVGGILFGYFVVLPGAVGFLQNFNASSFDALVQARSYYSFILLTLVASGLLFQIPVAVIGLTRARVVSTRQLRRHRRYAIVIITALALLLPGTDPVTTGLELAPMLLLYEASIVLASFLERRSHQGAGDKAAEHTRP